MSIELALGEVAERFAEMNPRSKELHERACDVLPGGHTRSVLYYEPFPVTVVSGDGAVIEDADGHRYLNLVGDFTAGVYGHNDPTIRAAVVDALDKGVFLSGVGETEVELARVIRGRIPSMERVRFCNSGSEADLWAGMLARAVTGRPKFLVFTGAYHGGFMIFGEVDSALNIPIQTVKAVYNDLEGTRALLRAHAEEIAAVFIEPIMGSGGLIPADVSFLQMLREETKAIGALLIFDEVMTSRLGVGGVQGEVGVKPDLTTLGKFWGGGFSFGAYGGSAEVMDHLDSRRPGHFPQSGTFNNNIMSMTAGLVGSRDVYTAEACRDLNARGDALREAINQLGERRQIPLQATGRGGVMNIHWSRKPIRDPRDVAPATHPKRRLAHLWMLVNGYYTTQRGMISLSLPITQSDLDGYIEALDRFVSEYRAILAD